MANQTITFNQPGIKIFMGDEIDFIKNQNNTLTVNIANTGENYLVVPTVYNVTGRNGEHPSGNASGNYLSRTAASNARASLIESAYNGQEYTATIGSYLTMAKLNNSDIFAEFGILPSEVLLFIDSKGYLAEYSTKSGNFDSSSSEWPNSVNSVGLWLSTCSNDDSDLGYYKINDYSTYNYQYYDMINIFTNNSYSKSSALNDVATFVDSSCNLYTAINNHNYTSTSKIILRLCYVVYPTTTIENVVLTVKGDYSPIQYPSINFLYNGSTPSQVLIPGLIQYESWRGLKIIGNEKVDTSSGRTESIIIVEPILRNDIYNSL